tara:strand:+ start:14026 stop:14412 length:387 start_codon:yes stop_codon:yes gene_type:complete
MTQLEEVRALLKNNPNGVCTTTFLKHHIPRFGHHIWTLRNDNWDIETHKCDLENCFHKSQQYKYVWSAIYLKEDNIPNDIVIKPLEKELEESPKEIVQEYNKQDRKEKISDINKMFAEKGLDIRLKNG